ncbi:MAG: alkaline phosphatase, partial [Myxococcaceae bacterium]|nr:alkaline phosphatase [Myxococcaceae bacterium]
VAPCGEPVPVHWEVSRQPGFRELERYGLTLASATSDFAVGIPLAGLEPGRRYWARFWAGGHWSQAVLLRSASHQTARAPAVASQRMLALAERRGAPPVTRR